MYKLFLLSIFLVLVQSCGGGNEEKSEPATVINSSSPSVQPQLNFFENTHLQLAYSYGANQPVGISCHNCYKNNSNKSDDDLKLVDYAISQRVNLIEFDIVFPEVNYIAPIVSHQQSSTGAWLDELLSDELLQQANQLLFLELKGKIVNQQHIRDLLNQLMQYKDDNDIYFYMNENRFITLRSFELESTLATVVSVLNEVEYSSIKEFVKLSQLSYQQQSSKYAIERAYRSGFHMIEFDAQIDLKEIKKLSEYAKSFGLAVNIFTLDEINYSHYVNELKNSVDVFTVAPNRQFDSVFEDESIFERVRYLIENE